MKSLASSIIALVVLAVLSLSGPPDVTPPPAATSILPSVQEMRAEYDFETLLSFGDLDKAVEYFDGFPPRELLAAAIQLGYLVDAGELEYSTYMIYGQGYLDNVAPIITVSELETLMWHPDVPQVFKVFLIDATSGYFNSQRKPNSIEFDELLERAAFEPTYEDYAQSYAAFHISDPTIATRVLGKKYDDATVEEDARRFLVRLRKVAPEEADRREQAKTAKSNAEK